MSKRFIDTDLWKKPWFMELTPSEKLAWFYVIAECDNVGVWTPNFRLAEFQIGQQLDWDKFRNKCHGNIILLENGKWFILDYCKFQHKDLNADSDENSKNGAVRSYIRALKDHGLWEIYRHYLITGEVDLTGVRRASDGRPTGPKEEDRERDREQEKEGDAKKTYVHVTKDGDKAKCNETRYRRLCATYGKSMTDRYIKKAVDYAIGNKGNINHYKDYATAAERYMEKDGVKPVDNNSVMTDDKLRRMREPE